MEALRRRRATLEVIPDPADSAAAEGSSAKLGRTYRHVNSTVAVAQSTTITPKLANKATAICRCDARTGRRIPANAINKQIAITGPGVYTHC
jgi:hypothetical protein